MTAVTLRGSASENGWSAVLDDGASKSFHQSPRYTVRVVDRIGGGDSFAAGLIDGFVSGRDLEATLKCAVAASALNRPFAEISPCHAVARPSPVLGAKAGQVSVAEVERLVAGDASGRVQR